MTFTLMPAAFTSTPSVQVQGFDDRCRLTRCDRLLCDSCSSGQCFACGFLQIPPRGGHPCRPASGSPCRAHRGLTPPSHPVSTTWTGTAPSRRYAPCLAHNAKSPRNSRAFSSADQWRVGSHLGIIVLVCLQPVPQLALLSIEIVFIVGVSAHMQRHSLGNSNTVGR